MTAQHVQEAFGKARVVRRRPNGHALDEVDDAPIVRQLEFRIAANLPDSDETFDDEIVERTLGRNTMAVIFGDSNSGKTFAAIDLGCRLSLSMQWLGKATAGGIVLYLATEAAGSVELRARAWQRFHGQRAPLFVIVRSPINLFDSNADATAVLALVAQIEAQLRGKVVLIIGDTLARMSAGANENSGEDMGIVLRHTDLIRAGTGATFLWIHHCGKNQAMGMRGWSGMRAAIDTEIEVTVDEATGLRSAEITKQRDLPGKGDRLGFKLATLSMGVNRWGNDRSTCVIVGSEAPAKKAQGRRPSEIAGAIEEALRNHGAGMHKGAMVKHFQERYTSSAVYREIGKMVTDGRLIESTGIVAIPGKPGGANKC